MNKYVIVILALSSIAPLQAMEINEQASQDLQNEATPELVEQMEAQIEARHKAWQEQDALSEARDKASKETWDAIDNVEDAQKALDAWKATHGDDTQSDEFKDLQNKLEAADLDYKSKFDKLNQADEAYRFARSKTAEYARLKDEKQQLQFEHDQLKKIVSEVEPFANALKVAFESVEKGENLDSISKKAQESQDLEPAQMFKFWDMFRTNLQKMASGLELIKDHDQKEVDGLQEQVNYLESINDIQSNGYMELSKNLASAEGKLQLQTRKCDEVSKALAQVNEKCEAARIDMEKKPTSNDPKSLFSRNKKEVGIVSLILVGASAWLIYSHYQSSDKKAEALPEE